MNVLMEGELMRVRISRLGSDAKQIVLADRGQSMTEYALICALLAFGTIAGYNGVAVKIGNAFNQLSSTFASTINTSGGGSTGGNTGGNAGSSGGNSSSNSDGKSRGNSGGAGGTGGLAGRGRFRRA